MLHKDWYASNEISILLIPCMPQYPAKEGLNQDYIRSDCRKRLSVCGNLRWEAEHHRSALRNWEPKTIIDAGISIAPIPKRLAKALKLEKKNRSCFSARFISRNERNLRE